MDLTKLSRNAVMVTINHRNWSGRKKMRPADLGIDESKLPPRSLATFGSRRTFNPKPLREIDQIMDSAMRQIENIGVRCGDNSWMVPIAAENQLAESLSKAQKDVAQKVAAIRKEYDQHIEDWINLPENRPWETFIRAAIEPPERVLGRIHFDWVFYPIGAPKAHTSPLITEALKEHTKSLAEQFLDEVSETARTSYKVELQGRPQASRRALRPIRRIREKLVGLSFLHDFARPLVKLIDATLDTLPKTGMIEGAPLLGLHGLVHILSDPERLRAYGQAILDGRQTAKEIVDAKMKSTGEVVGVTHGLDLEAPVTDAPAEEAAQQMTDAWI